MARFSEALIGKSGFAVTVAKYFPQWPPTGGKEAIVLLVELPDKTRTHFAVDTGAPCCILDPEIARNLGGQIEWVTDVRERTLADRGKYVEPPIRVGGQPYSGRKGSVTLTLVTEGNGAFQVYTTVFIPELRGEEWSMPNFIGMAFLNKIRWAVDPDDECFYLGPLGEALY